MNNRIPPFDYGGQVVRFNADSRINATEAAAQLTAMIWTTSSANSTTSTKLAN
jgi:hypothetical protein